MYCDETGSKGETQTVFVIDDDTLLRQALCSFLESEGFIVKNFATASAFLDAYRPEWQGCLLLDLSLPEIDGLELQQRLSVRGARLPIIFLTGKGDIPKAVQALKEGAVDFLQKPSTQDEILDRVRRALAEAPRGRNSDPGTSDILERYERLTQREREVMSLITSGLSNKHVARKLDISTRTAEGHRLRIMEKMRATSLLELTEMAQATGALNTLD